jgi:hypothetical protein
VFLIVRLSVFSFRFDVGTTFAYNSVSSRHSNGRNQHGKENFEEGKKAGSNKVPDDGSLVSRFL